MLKYFLVLVLLFTFYIPVYGQVTANDYSYQARLNDLKRRDDNLFAAATVVFFTGSAMDIASSYGQQEANPILKGKDNKFSLGRGLAITGGVYLIAYKMKDKHPKAARTLLFIAGSVRIVIGTRNFYIRGQNGKLVTVRN